MRLLKDKILYFLPVFIIFFQAINVFGQTIQTEEEKPKNIIEIIEADSEGVIQIEIPSDLLPLILKPEAPTKPSTGKKSPSTNPKVAEEPSKPKIGNKTQGYRIQVFNDGRNQSTLESRAKSRGSTILARFPKYRGQVYTFSKSPNWYTRVGNFETSQEANAALSELKKAFPNFAAEMRVVKSPIVIVK